MNIMRILCIEIKFPEVDASTRNPSVASFAPPINKAVGCRDGDKEDK